MGLAALPWAVHIADGVLSWPWLAGGFALSALLALLGAWRVRDEEVPRVALLTAAFFVASSIHLRLGPTSVHLLLNGLVGVVLGRRAPLAILVGVALQAALIPHGGFSTIGVNACTQALPALLAGWLFGVLTRAPWVRDGWFRSGLVGLSAAAWAYSVVFGVVLLWTNPLRDLVVTSSGAGLVVNAVHWEPALRVTMHPATGVAVVLFAAACAGGERRMGNAPYFPLGLLVGVVSVVATTALTGLVLLLDGADKWSTFVTLVFLAHLPLAVLEGLVLGCTVGFLARVKPELLGVETEPAPSPAAEPNEPIPVRPPALLLVAAGLLLSAGPAQAHRLKADCPVNVAHKRVTVESYFETGDVPKKGEVRVLRGDGSVLAEGPLDEKGEFAFTYEEAEPLTVVVTAPGGHRAECPLSAEALGGADPPAPPGPAERPRGRSLLLGVVLILGGAALVLVLRRAGRAGG
jgi:cobalt/nickel transport system permease protein